MLRFDSERRDDLLERAASEAVQKHTAIGRLIDSEARIVVVVSRTAGDPAVAGGADFLQPAEDPLYFLSLRGMSSHLSGCWLTGSLFFLSALIGTAK